MKNNKVKWKRISIFLIVVLLCSTFFVNRTAFADNEISGDFKYEILNDQSGVMITDYLGQETEVTVPAMIEGQPVVGIGVSAFDYGTFEKVILPESVRFINQDAFRQCKNLQTIVIPDGLKTVGQRAFVYCTELRELHFGSSLREIDSFAFNACWKLEKIEVDENNPNFRSVDGVLFDKELKELICYPGGKTGDSYEIPESVNKIWEYGFVGNAHLKYVTVPGSVQSIPMHCFHSCTNLEKVFIEDGPEKIGGYVFWHCSNLKNVRLPNTLTEIETAMLADTSLTYLVIPPSVEKIWDYDTELGTFPSNEYFTIFGVAGSAAQIYAENFNYTFVDISNIQSLQQDFETGLLFQKVDLSVFEKDEKVTVSESTVSDEEKELLGAAEVKNAYDISYWKGNEQREPDVPIEVTVPLDSKDRNEYKVMYISKARSVQEVKADRVNNLLSFEADKNGTYALVAEVVNGDVFEDGKINNKDLLKLQQYLAGWAADLSELQQKAADVFQDGKINNKDLLRLQQYLAGWNVQLDK